MVDVADVLAHEGLAGSHSSHAHDHTHSKNLFDVRAGEAFMGQDRPGGFWSCDAVCGAAEMDCSGDMLERWNNVSSV